MSGEICLDSISRLHTVKIGHGSERWRKFFAKNKIVRLSVPVVARQLAAKLCIPPEV